MKLEILGSFGNLSSFSAVLKKVLLSFVFWLLFCQMKSCSNNCCAEKVLVHKLSEEPIHSYKGATNESICSGNFIEVLNNTQHIQSNETYQFRLNFVLEIRLCCRIRDSLRFKFRNKCSSSTFLRSKLRLKRLLFDCLRLKRLIFDYVRLKPKLKILNFVCLRSKFREKVRFNTYYLRIISKRNCSDLEYLELNCSNTQYLRLNPKVNCANIRLKPRKQLLNTQNLRLKLRIALSNIQYLRLKLKIKFISTKYLRIKSKLERKIIQYLHFKTRIKCLNKKYLQSKSGINISIIHGRHGKSQLPLDSNFTKNNSGDATFERNKFQMFDDRLQALDLIDGNEKSLLSKPKSIASRFSNPNNVENAPVRLSRTILSLKTTDNPTTIVSTEGRNSIKNTSTSIIFKPTINTENNYSIESENNFKVSPNGTNLFENSNSKISQTFPSGLICKDNWQLIRGQCYRLFEDKLRWTEAEETCQKFGGHLTSITSFQQAVELDLFAKEKIGENNTRTENIWIGATDKNFENAFVWSSGALFDFTDWFDGWADLNGYGSQPSDDGFSSEDCVELRRSFRLATKGFRIAKKYYWNDRNCDVKNFFICQITTNRENTPQIKNDPCNQTIFIEPGAAPIFVTSPNFPSKYNVGSNCVAKLFTKDDAVITITFDAFYLEKSERCLYDYVQIENSTKRSGERICGNWFDRLKLLHFTSKRNFLALKFRSDEAHNYDGFKAKITAASGKNGCGAQWQIRYKSKCIMASNVKVTWNTARTICKESQGTLVRIDDTISAAWLTNWLQYHPQYNPKIRYWIGGFGTYQWMLRDSYKDEEKPFQKDASKICLSVGAVSADNEQGVKSAVGLVSYPCESLGGYICSKTVQDINWNTSAIQTGVIGRIVSVNYPKQYPNDVSATTLVVAPEGNRIVFNFEKLSLEFQKDCLYDYVSFSDQSEKDSEVRFCGHQMKPGKSPAFVSKSNRVVVAFHTDWLNNFLGFELKWKAVNTKNCQDQIFTNQTGILTSPNFPDSLLDDMKCEFTIRVAEGLRIWLSFDYFDVRQSTDENPFANEALSRSKHRQHYLETLSTVKTCKENFVLIDISEKEKLKICGQMKNSPKVFFVSKTNFLKIFLKTSNFPRGNGFKMTYKTGDSFNDLINVDLKERPTADLFENAYYNVRKVFNFKSYQNSSNNFQHAYDHGKTYDLYSDDANFKGVKKSKLLNGHSILPDIEKFRRNVHSLSLDNSRRKNFHDSGNTKFQNDAYIDGFKFQDSKSIIQVLKLKSNYKDNVYLKNNSTPQNYVKHYNTSHRQSKQIVASRSNMSEDQHVFNLNYIPKSNSSFNLKHSSNIYANISKLFLNDSSKNSSQNNSENHFNLNIYPDVRSKNNISNAYSSKILEINPDSYVNLKSKNYAKNSSKAKNKLLDDSAYHEYVLPRLFIRPVNFPFPSPEKVNVTYFLHAPFGHKISLTINYFGRLEKRNSPCTQSYLELEDWYAGTQGKVLRICLLDSVKREKITRFTSNLNSIFLRQVYMKSLATSNIENNLSDNFRETSDNVYESFNSNHTSPSNVIGLRKENLYDKSSNPLNDRLNFKNLKSLYPNPQSKLFPVVKKLQPDLKYFNTPKFFNKIKIEQSSLNGKHEKSLSSIRSGDHFGDDIRNTVQSVNLFKKVNYNIRHAQNKYNLESSARIGHPVKLFLNEKNNVKSSTKEKRNVPSEIVNENNINVISRRNVISTKNYESMSSENYRRDLVSNDNYKSIVKLAMNAKHNVNFFENNRNIAKLALNNKIDAEFITRNQSNIKCITNYKRNGKSSVVKKHKTAFKGKRNVKKSTSNNKRKVKSNSNDKRNVKSTSNNKRNVKFTSNNKRKVKSNSNDKRNVKSTSNNKRNVKSNSNNKCNAKFSASKFKRNIKSLSSENINNEKLSAKFIKNASRSDITYSDDPYRIEVNDFPQRRKNANKKNSKNFPTFFKINYDIIQDFAWKNRTLQWAANTSTFNRSGVDSCSHFPCFNEGSCVSASAKHKCICPPLYTGNFCQFRWCETKPCMHGACISLNTAPGYQCNCDQGWSGERCNIVVSPCSRSTCFGRGDCTVVGGTFKCQCHAWWSGPRCETRLRKIPFTPLSEKMFTDPFWLGLITIAVVMTLISIVFCIKKHFAEKIEKFFAQEIERSKYGGHNRPPICPSPTGNSPRTRPKSLFVRLNSFRKSSIMSLSSTASSPPPETRNLNFEEFLKPSKRFPFQRAKSSRSESQPNSTKTEPGKKGRARTLVPPPVTQRAPSYDELLSLKSKSMNRVAFDEYCAKRSPSTDAYFDRSLLAPNTSRLERTLSADMAELLVIHPQRTSSVSQSSNLDECNYVQETSLTILPSAKLDKKVKFAKMMQKIREMSPSSETNFSGTNKSDVSTRRISSDSVISLVRKKSPNRSPKLKYFVRRSHSGSGSEEAEYSGSESLQEPAKRLLKSSSSPSSKTSSPQNRSKLTKNSSADSILTMFRSVANTARSSISSPTSPFYSEYEDSIAQDSPSTTTPSSPIKSLASSPKDSLLPTGSIQIQGKSPVVPIITLEVPSSADQYRCLSPITELPTPAPTPSPSPLPTPSRYRPRSFSKTTDSSTNNEDTEPEFLTGLNDRSSSESSGSLEQKILTPTRIKLCNKQQNEFSFLTSSKRSDKSSPSHSKKSFPKRNESSFKTKFKPPPLSIKHSNFDQSDQIQKTTQNIPLINVHDEHGRLLEPFDSTVRTRSQSLDCGVVIQTPVITITCTEDTPKSAESDFQNVSNFVVPTFSFTVSSPTCAYKPFSDDEITRIDDNKKCKNIRTATVGKNIIPVITITTSLSGSISSIGGTSVEKSTSSLQYLNPLIITSNVHTTSDSNLSSSGYSSAYSSGISRSSSHNVLNNTETDEPITPTKIKLSQNTLNNRKNSDQFDIQSGSSLQILKEESSSLNQDLSSDQDSALDTDTSDNLSSNKSEPKSKTRGVKRSKSDFSQKRGFLTSFYSHPNPSRYLARSTPSIAIATTSESSFEDFSSSGDVITSNSSRSVSPISESQLNIKKVFLKNFTGRVNLSLSHPNFKNILPSKSCETLPISSNIKKQKANKMWKTNTPNSSEETSETKKGKPKRVLSLELLLSRKVKKKHKKQRFKSANFSRPSSCDSSTSTASADGSVSPLEILSDICCHDNKGKVKNKKSKPSRKRYQFLKKQVLKNPVLIRQSPISDSIDENNLKVFNPYFILGDKNGKSISKNRRSTSNKSRLFPIKSHSLPTENLSVPPVGRNRPSKVSASKKGISLDAAEKISKISSYLNLSNSADQQRQNLISGEKNNKFS